MSRTIVAFIAVVCLTLSPARPGPTSGLGHASAGEQTAAFPAPHSADDAKLYHWPRLPVRVFIAVDNADERDWSRIAVAGFDEWVQATQGAVAYRLVDTPQQAQVSVRFVPTPTVPDRPDLVGLTTTYWTGPVLQSADVVLAAGRKTPAELQTAAAHELGHALGIRGHSANPADLMFPAPLRAHGASAHPVTPRDLDTLKRCYPALFAR